MNTTQFVAQNNIRIESEMVGENPNMDSSNWQAYHYKVVLKFRTKNGKRRQLTTYFSMGMGLSREPQADDVLDCLAGDATSAENARDFEDWAGEFGYDTDSRKAERTYKTILRQSKRLAQFMGTELYEQLLYNTERL